MATGLKFNDYNDDNVFSDFAGRTMFVQSLQEGWSSMTGASSINHRVTWLLLAMLIPGVAWSQEFGERSIRVGSAMGYRMDDQDHPGHQEHLEHHFGDNLHGDYEPHDMIVGCTTGACGPCGVTCQEPCCVGPVGSIWVHGEYLMWWAKGMETPPLVTAGPTGTLDDNRTIVLFGDDDLLGQMRSGFRVRLGTWLDYSQRWALEGEYWRLGGVSESFVAASDMLGNPTIYRPFFNVNPRGADGQFDPPARQDVQLVSHPGVLAGSVRVQSSSQLQGSGIWLRRNLCCDMTAVIDCDPCFDPGSGPFGHRFDFLIGYRYARLGDRLTIREDLKSLRGEPFQGNFDLLDSFASSNDFHGAELGLLSEFDYGRWSLELLGRLALGGVRQQVTIAGQTIISGSVSDGTYEGGLLAQRTNSGTHSRNEFAFMPQLGATVGYRLTPRLQATVGYSLLYLSRVVRAGEHIDLDVNPDLLAPETTPLAGALRPDFQFRDSDFWAQGMNFGLHFAW